jgi:hypothetical protein
LVWHKNQLTESRWEDQMPTYIITSMALCIFSCSTYINCFLKGKRIGAGLIG